jgi:hypothetical protein
MSARPLIVCTALLLASIAAHAIDAPKPASAQPPAAEPTRAAVTPTDEKAFYERLQKVAHRRMLRDLKVSGDIAQMLARGEADVAVASLSKQAAAVDEHAIVALVRIQNWCGRASSARPADVQAQIAKLNPDLGPERASRAAGVLMAEAEYLPRAKAACGRAVFDYGGIEAQLRQAAAAGQPLSTTELAQFTRDAAKREAMLQAAADKNYAPAMYALATQRLVAVQRGETTQNVASIRALLKQAGRTLPKAKLDLANCMALGCDGHPADAAAASAFGLDAARDGEPTAYLSMVRMPWGSRYPRAQLLAWQYFGDRLNESGCSGEAYLASSMAFAQAIKLIEQGQDAKLIDQAKEQADALWRDNGARAMKEQGCE